MNSEDSRFYLYDALALLLPIIITAANLLIAWRVRRNLDVPAREKWRLVVPLVVLFGLTAVVWFAVALPFSAGFAGSYATFASYETTLAVTQPSPLDPNYIEYQKFMARYNHFYSTLGNLKWLLLVLLMDIAVFMFVKPTRRASTPSPSP